MTHIFISYATEDSTPADLVKMKLEQAGVDVWLDHESLHGGHEWRDSIDDGIAASRALLVVVTPRSMESSYVTYEWAFALGKGIRVIPLLFEDAEVHPRLSALQYRDFRDQRTGPWDALLKDVGAGGTGDSVGKATSDNHGVARDRILEYLQRNDIRMVRFKTIRQKIDPSYDDDFLYEVIRRNHRELRTATLEGDEPGVGRH